MKYEKIEQALFINNRKRFCKELKPKSLAIFNSNDVMPTNGDGTMPFRQNSDLFYLSGVDQEESLLLLFPDCSNPELREVLFVKETNDHIAVWEGAKLNKEQSFEISGIKTVYWLDHLESILSSVTDEVENIYLNRNKHSRATIEVETRDARFAKWVRGAYANHNYECSASIMHHLRAVKEAQEVELIQKACNLTESAFLKILKKIKPGTMEYEIEADIIHEFISNRSRGFAYAPIIASGKNACILHYTDNNAVCKDGDVILMDFAAEYANYASDLTRCVPVSGKFTKRQKDVYNAVLRVMKSATKMLVPGTLLSEYNKKVGRFMEQELLGLGLLTQSDVDNQSPESPAYRKYFMHGTSHFLGLDVHDVGSFSRVLEAGMVFTCEPGIYIPEENLGIRLENDILVTENGPLDLMANIPIEANDIEFLMRNQ
jgi:Xaa-Pro aminopeptidase